MLFRVDLWRRYLGLIGGGPCFLRAHITLICYPGDPRRSQESRDLVGWFYLWAAKVMQ